jgi:hypothetical protein
MTGVKLTAITFGVVMAGVFFFTGLSRFEEDELSFGVVSGVFLASLAAGALMGLLYVPVNRFLHKRGLSMHDDRDFEE